MKPAIDLHIHSRHSDGIHTPAELLDQALQLGIRAIALADHDSVSGVNDAIYAGEKAGIEVIPAVELSVEYRSFTDIHLLGYFIDHCDEAFCRHLKQFRYRRDSRGQEIIEKINEKLKLNCGGEITYDEVTAESDGALGRPHLARVLVKKGFSPSMESAFENYLVPCNVPKEYFPVETAINEIHRMNGLAVLAHPTTISKNRTTLREVVSELARLGLDGLEAYNNLATIEDTEFLLGLARTHRVCVTYGSDFHGGEDNVRFGADTGVFRIDYSIVEEMKKRISERNRSN